MKRMPLPPAEYIRQIFDYNPETGVLRWKNRTDVLPAWNGRFAGKTIGEKTSWGYLAVTINGKTYMLHNLIWVYMTGNEPSGIVDHEDLNRTNNKWNNLRDATRSENQCNRRIQSNNTSGYKGVTFDKSRNLWSARVNLQGKVYNLGRFKTAEEAHAIYLKAAKEKHGEFVRVA